MLRSAPSPVLVTAVVAMVAAGGVISSVRYVGFWHTLNESDGWIHTLDSEVRRLGRVDLADTAVPEGVISAAFAPDNAVSKMTPLVGGHVEFPDSSSRLGVVARDGTIRMAVVDASVRSKEGPAEGCGWRVRTAGRTIPLTGRAFDWVWWLRIGYLYSDEAQVTITAGEDEIEAALMPGLNDLYVRIHGGFDEIRIDGVTPGTTACIDTVEVGQVEPGSPMS